LKKKLSLGLKTTLLIIAAYALFAAVSVAISYSVYSGDIDDHYMTLAKNIAWTAASFMDGDRIPTYAETLKTDAEYERMLEILFRIKEKNDITFLYVEVIRGENAMYIMDADRDPKTACPLGYISPLAKPTIESLGHLEDGIPPFITRSGFGWLASAYAPIFDSSGKVSAIVGADISMNEIMGVRRRYLANLVLLTITAAALTAAASLMLTKRFVVSPINALAKAATSFVSEGRGKDSSGLSISAMSSIDIHTGDEIESLSVSMKSMALDIVEYIANITAITAERERSNAELNVAAQIQTSMLPQTFPPYPERREFDLYAMMIPAKEVGGDFYDFFTVDGDHLALVIGDVSGKGVPAALFMVISKTILKEQITLNENLESALIEANRQLCENNGADMFVTVWAGVLEISTGRLSFVNAGHNPPLLRRDRGSFEFINTPPALALAIMPDIAYARHELTLAAGEMLYLYTDGVTEATDARQILYGNGRLKDALDSADSLRIEELLLFMLKDLKGFMEETPQADDITMLGVRLNARNSAPQAEDRGFHPHPQGSQLP
jgi:sigma-B regulation protein RsbU (phosphoserine phosphatase)